MGVRKKCISVKIAPAVHMQNNVKRQIKAFPVWTTHDSAFPNWKIYCSKWIFMILLVCSLFLEHGKFHIFFHSMLPTEDVIVLFH